ncbi:MAG TPA: polysaccharide deacetylase family protein [Anaerolineales bacterium]|nr:polysaccharide deacetylase family protein [Anaerolineales bacterium]
MNYRIFVIALLTVLLAGCNGMVVDAPTATQTASLLPPTATATVTPTPSITPTFTQTPIPSPTWVSQGPGHVQVPIFMYHHVSDSPIGSDYYVPPEKFDVEMKLLHDWGYTTITTSMLVQAITQGVSLPPRPIIISFDDSWESQYSNAFPIMKKYGFTGVLYTVVSYIGRPSGLTTDPSYLTADQLKEMAAAGWEIGSHTETHQNVTVMTDDQLHYEIVQSRKDLQQELGVPILTFAYPFGGANSAVIDYVHFAGYIAAMGATGFTADQGKGNLFELQRCEIKYSDDAKSIIRFLPWLGNPAFIPTDTPTETPTSTWTPIPTWTMYPTSTSWKATKTPTP